MIYHRQPYNRKDEASDDDDKPPEGGGNVATRLKIPMVS